MIVAAVLLGVVIGLVMGALGGGGSVLTVPVLVFVLGLPASEATSSSLVIVGVAAVFAALGHARVGHVRWRVAAILTVSGVPTSVLGSQLNERVNEDLLLLLFAVLLLVAAGGMLLRSGDEGSSDGRSGDGASRAERSAQGESGTDRTRTGPLVVTGLAVGLITGFLGVGGGFVIVPVLVALLGFPVPLAAGTSLVVISLNAAVSLTARAGSLDHLEASVIVPFTLAAILGSLVGGRVAGRVSTDRLTGAFAGLLLLVAVYTAVQAVLGLT